MTVRLIGTYPTEAAALEALAARGMRPLFLERGPDGLVRGLAVEDETEEGER